MGGNNLVPRMARLVKGARTPAGLAGAMRFTRSRAEVVLRQQLRFRHLVQSLPVFLEFSRSLARAA